MRKHLSPLRHPPLHERAEKFLKELIRQGEWADLLPPEKELALQMDISRPVLRQALLSLGQQGLIHIAHGRRTRVLHRTETRPRLRREVLVAGPKALDGLGQTPLIAELRRRLEAKNYLWTLFHDLRLSSRRGPVLLSKRMAQAKPACLLLVHSTESLQKWAHDHSAPAVVLGTTFPNIDLPSIDTDYHALGWHAAGKLRKAGHQRVSLLVSSHTLGGDEATRQGVLDYFQSLPGNPCSFSFDHVSAEPAEFQIEIDRILNRRNPPTAFFSFLPLHTLTLLTHLQQKGRQIPRDVAIISRDSDFYLDATVPEPARYQRNDAAFITQTIRLVEKVSSQAAVTKKCVRLIPAFNPGRTI